MNRLFFGDNLDWLRNTAEFPDACVDLVYLDPPFNSKRDYNLLFKSPKGHESEAQITAFEDSWHWGEQAEREFDELVHAPNTDVSEMMQALRRFLGENDMMAYLTMMANRLLQLHRVLKPTGSLYLHCDPTASHYLKIALDGVFGKENFRNEIIWKRTTSHNDARRQFPDVTDTIFYYVKTDDAPFHRQFVKYSDNYLKTKYRHVDAAGRVYRLSDLRSPSPRPNLTYTYKGHEPHPNGWAVSREKMEAYDAAGRLEFPKKQGGRIQLRNYLDERDGMPLTMLWDDISPINAMAQERLGYPTQKPVALLERIIQASSNEGDVVLDPFCGCGTAVHAAQKLNRQWIGIDITHLAISLIEKRLKDAFGAGRAGSPLPAANNQDATKSPDGAHGVTRPTSKLEYVVHGTPKDLDAARDLATRDKYQFQWWAVSLVEAQPFQGKKRGADTGIDGVKFFGDYVVPETKSKNAAQIHKTCKMVVSVKGGGIKADDVRALNHVREREGAEIGLFISLQEPTRGMVADAASAGFYQDGAGRKFPRVQLLTIEGLLSGKQRAEHPDHQPDLNFKKAKVEPHGKQKELI